MKHIAVLSFVILFIQSATGQNWSLINATERFHYTVNGSMLISETIKADSVAVNGMDSGYVLQYAIGGHSQGEFFYQSKNGTEKWLITSVSASIQEVILEVNVISDLNYHTPFTDSTQIIQEMQTVTYTKNIEMPEELYPEQIVEIRDDEGDIQDRNLTRINKTDGRYFISNGWVSIMGQQFTGLHFTDQNNMNICYPSPESLPQNLALGFTDSNDASEYYNPCLAVYYEIIGKAWGEGLGIISSSHSGEAYSNDGSTFISDSWSSYRNLQGYVKDGDTTGVITSDEDLLIGIIEKQPTEAQIYLLPNPASSYLIVKGLPDHADFVAEIFDATGKTLYRTSKQPTKD